MNSKFKIQNSKFKILVFSFTFYFLLFTFSCSIPNLEKPECTQAKMQVKKLYSFHFGNDMKPSKENLKLREEYLTAELKQELEKQTETKKDYFTQTDDYPKAFRIGECAVVEADKKVNLQVVLFWRDDKRSEQREVNVEAVKENETWLVNKVESRN
jgi:hypothetical protein